MHTKLNLRLAYQTLEASLAEPVCRLIFLKEDKLMQNKRDECMIHYCDENITKMHLVTYRVKLVQNILVRN